MWINFPENQLIIIGLRGSAMSRLNMRVTATRFWSRSLMKNPPKGITPRTFRISTNIPHPTSGGKGRRRHGEKVVGRQVTYCNPFHRGSSCEGHDPQEWMTH